MIIPGFVGPSFTLKNTNADAEMCMNRFPANIGAQSAGAKAPWILQPCPGFETAVGVAQSPGRGLFALGAVENRGFGAVGFKIYEYLFDSATETWSATDRGDIASDDRPVTWAWNGAPGDMVFTSGGVVYAYDLSNDNITDVSSLSGVNIQQVVYLNGRFLALDADNNTVYWSDLNAATFPGDAFSRSTAPDPWVAMSVVRGQLWLMGTQTTDVYQTTTDPNNPYAPVSNFYIEYGCAAAFSATNLDGTLVAVTKNANGQAQVRRSNGYELDRISTDAVDYALSTYDEVSDAVAFSYQEQGHYFCVINFPTAGATWVYDTTDRVWHQRGKWNSDLNAYQTYRAQYSMSLFGFNMVQDNQTGTLYTMSTDFNTEVDGEGIRWERRTPAQWDGNQLNRIFYPGIRIDMKTGTGAPLTTPPVISLRYSDDGGLSFPVELDASIGNIGESMLSVDFLMLGSSRNRVWSLVGSDDAYYGIIGAVYRPDPTVGVS